MDSSSEGLCQKLHRCRHTLHHFAGFDHQDAVYSFHYAVLLCLVPFWLFKDGAFPSQVLVPILWGILTSVVWSKMFHYVPSLTFDEFEEFAYLRTYFGLCFQKVHKRHSDLVVYERQKICLIAQWLCLLGPHTSMWTHWSRVSTRFDNLTGLNKRFFVFPRSHATKSRTSLISSLAGPSSQLSVGTRCRIPLEERWRRSLCHSIQCFSFVALATCASSLS